MDKIVHNRLIMPNQKILKSIKNKPYFKDKSFVLYLDDAINVLNQLPVSSVDMIFADPPYNLSNGGFSVYAGKRVSVARSGLNPCRRRRAGGSAR